MINAKEAAERFFAGADDVCDDTDQTSILTEIIQQCIDDALEAVAVQIESAVDRNWREGWPADWAVRIARRAMKSNERIDP